MAFGISQKTLERLEWPAVLARLAGCARTPLGRARLAAAERCEAAAKSLFEASIEGVRERLAETGEARAILDAGDRPPLGDAVDLAAPLLRARKGGVLSTRELRDLGATLAALRETRRFLGLRRGEAPRLAALAERIAERRELERDIEEAVDLAGEVRDAASPLLASSRREAQRLVVEIQQRLEGYLRDPDTVSRLSDRYYTVRHDRYVLPVRADARGSLRGIVHDASGSGTTLFIEPEALVELNNRHKRAEIEIERETLRVLRALSERAAASADPIEAGLGALEAIDLAFARAELARAMDAAAPEVGTEGILRLPQLRHPALPADRAVPNDLQLGEGFTVLVLSGPNAGGKTVAMKAAALAALFVRAGLQVPAAPGARVDLFDEILADIGDEQDIRENLSTFSAHIANLARIAERASARSLVVLDEVGEGTDPGEGAALAQAVLEALADAGARVIATTHFNLLKEMAEVDRRFANASVEFDPETLAPTYRLRIGLPGTSSATAVAARMGLRGDVLERANQLLEREDRRLDRMLAELAASRASLDRERREATRARAETEAARAEYRGKLEKLQRRRDQLYRSMRDDLDRAFREAHRQVAGVIRELQRGGSARDAARAREHLQRIEERRREAERGTGLASGPDPGLERLDWRFASAGDPVRVPGAGEGVLLALPDRRGRAAVRIGSARVLVPAERVGAARPSSGEKLPAARGRRAAAAPARAGPERAGEDGVPEAGAGRCDLRGMRVEEALDRLVYALDRAASAGRDSLVIVHGIGTGALRDAVRRHLAESPYVTDFAPGTPATGGDGATTAKLA